MSYVEEVELVEGAQWRMWRLIEEIVYIREEYAEKRG